MAEVTNEQLYELMKDIQKGQEALLSRFESNGTVAPYLDDDLRAELAAFLAPRLAEIEAGKFSEKSVNDIFEEVYEEMGYDVNAR